MNTTASTTPATPTLVFVYNARSGLLSMLKDAVHKTLSPQTYPCKLCDITYSPVRMRAQWKSFISNLPYAVEFSYPDLIEKEFAPGDRTWPNAWIKYNNQLHPWLSAAQINACTNLQELMDLVLRHLPEAERIVHKFSGVGASTSQVS